MWGAFMKRFYLNFLCAILLLVLLFTFISVLVISRRAVVTGSYVANGDTFTVIVDAGHGGEDGGAVAPDGSPEKDFNLDIALKLENILKLYGFEVIMTRSTDKMTCDDGLDTQRAKKVSDIKNRLKLIQRYPEAVFVSIHQNNFQDRKQNGTQVFYSKNNFRSKELADLIQDSIVNNLQKDNKRLTKKSGTEIYLLYHSNNPSVLVECGFLSNEGDLSLLKNENYRFEIALLIADGIMKYRFQR